MHPETGAAIVRGTGRLLIGQTAPAWLLALAFAMVLSAGGQAHAQALRVSSVEVVTGRAGFVDEVWDALTVYGGAVRLQVTPRFAAGPEIAYLDGPGRSHDLTITGTGTVDLTAPRSDRRVVPFVVFAAGVVRQTSIVGRGPGTAGLASYTSSDGTVSGGMGIRVVVGRHWAIAPDVRVGYEPETRFGVAVAWRP